MHITSHRVSSGGFPLMRDYNREPPLASIICPVTQRLSSEARKAAISATSVGWPHRPNVESPAANCCPSCVAKVSTFISVSISSIAGPAVSSIARIRLNAEFTHIVNDPIGQTPTDNRRSLLCILNGYASEACFQEGFNRWPAPLNFIENSIRPDQFL